MGSLVHTIPFMIKDESDVAMAEVCLASLGASDALAPVVVYNQGRLANSEVKSLFNRHGLVAIILGHGENVGIPQARQACFNYIWGNLPGIDFVSEFHLDMFFPPVWAEPLMGYLDEHAEEPMISPGIVTTRGEVLPAAGGSRLVTVPADPAEWPRVLESLRSEGTREGFVHPVIHRATALKAVGGYDIRFLQGKQGYEDDSLLLGYRYYVGRRAGWRPKAFLGVYVHHAGLGQRMKLENINAEFARNLRGLVNQYGVYGLLELAELHQNPEFTRLAQSLMG